MSFAKPSWQTPLLWCTPDTHATSHAREASKAGEPQISHHCQDDIIGTGCWDSPAGALTGAAPGEGSLRDLGACLMCEESWEA